MDFEKIIKIHIEEQDFDRIVTDFYDDFIYRISSYCYIPEDDALLLDEKDRNILINKFCSKLQALADKENEE